MDLIDRQKTIEMLEGMKVKDPFDRYEKQNIGLDWAIDTLKALPSAQTCEDAVSRADVIELVKDSYYNLAESIEDTWAMVADVEKLPAVQSEPKPDENGSEPFGNAEMLGDRTTDDCISRQAAIETLNEQIEYCNKALGSFDISPKDEYAVKVERASLEVYKEQLENLPSAQPEMNLDEWCTDCKEYDQEKHCCPRWNRVIRQTLSEQTEIIRCKDCKHADDDGVCQNSVGLVIQDDDDFCSYAERREHGSD